MKRFVIALVWLLILAAAGFFLDRLLLGPKADSVALRETQIFYRDFRSRVVALLRNRPISAPAAPAPTTAEKGSKTSEPVAKPAVAPIRSESSDNGGYVYVDQEGTIHLVNRLDDVPVRYRKEAKPLHK